MTRIARLAVLPKLIALGLPVAVPGDAAAAAQSCADDFEALVAKAQENCAG